MTSQHECRTPSRFFDDYGLCPDCNTSHGALPKGKVWYPIGEL